MVQYYPYIFFAFGDWRTTKFIKLATVSINGKANARYTGHHNNFLFGISEKDSRTMKNVEPKSGNSLSGISLKYMGSCRGLTY